MPGGIAGFQQSAGKAAELFYGLQVMLIFLHPVLRNLASVSLDGFYFVRTAYDMMIFR